MSSGESPGKAWFRCAVCNNVHYGLAGPKVCPTRGTVRAYVQVSQLEAQAAGELITRKDEIKSRANLTTKEDVKELFTGFTEEKEYELNPDASFLGLVLDGLLKNEEDTGLKYCPCRLRADDYSYNLTLHCPCNFTSQATYANEGRCWCGLFTKRG